jgi:hypothetical protein
MYFWFVKERAIIILIAFCMALGQPFTGSTQTVTVSSKTCNKESCHHKKQQKDCCAPCNSYTCTNVCCTIYLPETALILLPVELVLRTRQFLHNDNRTEVNQSECFHPPELSVC